MSDLIKGIKLTGDSKVYDIDYNSLANKPGIEHITADIYYDTNSGVYLDPYVTKTANEIIQLIEDGNSIIASVRFNYCEPEEQPKDGGEVILKSVSANSSSAPSGYVITETQYMGDFNFSQCEPQYQYISFTKYNIYKENSSKGTIEIYYLNYDYDQWIYTSNSIHFTPVEITTQQEI